MQMVSVYKDPTGKNVFPKTIPKIPSDVRCLQMRMQCLENQVSQVCC